MDVYAKSNILAGLRLTETSKPGARLRHMSAVTLNQLSDWRAEKLIEVFGHAEQVWTEVLECVTDTSCGACVAGYRDDSLETVKRNEQQYQIPLEVVSYKQLYGWTMDEIVREIGTKNNCTFCGVFRRQALDRGATMMKVGCSPERSKHQLLCKLMAFLLGTILIILLRQSC